MGAVSCFCPSLLSLPLCALLLIFSFDYMPSVDRLPVPRCWDCAMTSPNNDEAMCGPEPFVLHRSLQHGTSTMAGALIVVKINWLKEGAPESHQAGFRVL